LIGTARIVVSARAGPTSETAVVSAGATVQSTGVVRFGVTAYDDSAFPVTYMIAVEVLVLSAFDVAVRVQRPEPVPENTVSRFVVSLSVPTAVPVHDTDHVTFKLVEPT